MASPCLILQRGIATSCARHGKRNFRKFQFPNKRGTRAFKEKQRTDPYPDYPIDHRGARDTGYKMGDKWVQIPEKVPELIVPSLKDFDLKPYVSYRVNDLKGERFTAKSLFDKVYAPKIIEDYKKKELLPNGDPVNPSENEKLTPQEAKDQAAKTGSDMFTQNRGYAKGL